MAQRVAILERSHGIQITTALLKRFYTEHKIKRRLGYEVYKACLANHKVVERREFSVVMASIVARRKPLIYVDETVFSSWATRQKSSWSLVDKPNYHLLTNDKWKTTVYGAIGNCL